MCVELESRLCAEIPSRSEQPLMLCLPNLPALGAARPVLGFGSQCGVIRNPRALKRIPRSILSRSCLLFLSSNRKTKALYEATGGPESDDAPFDSIYQQAGAFLEKVLAGTSSRRARDNADDRKAGGNGVCFFARSQFAVVAGHCECVQNRKTIALEAFTTTVVGLKQQLLRQGSQSRGPSFWQGDAILTVSS